MLEIEQKYAGADFAAIEARLRKWGAEKGDEQDEADHYFNAPDRDFARTDEAFRLRRVGPANCLTYKGPKQAAAVKKRVELEVPLEEGDEAAQKMIQLLVCLGYRPVTVVRKHRRALSLTAGGTGPDHLPGPGRGAEGTLRRGGGGDAAGTTAGSGGADRADGHGAGVEPGGAAFVPGDGPPGTRGS